MTSVVTRTVTSPVFPTRISLHPVLHRCAAAARRRDSDVTPGSTLTLTLTLSRCAAAAARRRDAGTDHARGRRGPRRGVHGEPTSRGQRAPHDALTLTDLAQP
eukprot:scaffold22208_cov65-Phaeocystis_antarctica.AAC.1